MCYNIVTTKILKKGLRESDYIMKKRYEIGEVIWVKLYGEGSIQQGTRPAVIIQNNVGNKYSDTIQVVPLTSRMTKSKLPTHVFIPMNTAGLTRNSIAQCEGARPVLKDDILGHIGFMPDEYMAQISIASMVSTPIIQYLSEQEIIAVYQQLVGAVKIKQNI